jgi:RND family efflux transporter MFP subunit
MSQLSKRARQAWKPALVGLGLLAFVGAAVSGDEPPIVEVVQAIKREVKDHEIFTGRLEAVEKVELRPRVSGYLAKVYFPTGGMARKGELLFEIDPRPYKAVLDKAEAELAAAKARAKFAEKERDRLRRLAATGAASKEELDQAELRQIETQAVVHAMQANVEVARLNLEFTRTVAPFNGKVGFPTVTSGDLVVGPDVQGIGSTRLATIVSLDPMYVYFDMDERTFLRMKRLELDGQLGKGPIPIAMGLAGEEGFPHKGTVDGLDNRIDPKTGTIRVRGVFANPKGLFLPGLYSRVRLPVSKPYTALVVPKSALMSGEAGRKFVYVVSDDNIAAEVGVITGAEVQEAKTSWQVIRTGLKPGEWVIVNGQRRAPRIESPGRASPDPRPLIIVSFHHKPEAPAPGRRVPALALRACVQPLRTP